MKPAKTLGALFCYGTRNTPLSAMTGETPCGLSLYCSPLRIDIGAFGIAVPSAPVLPLSLQLGTMIHRIISRVYSLRHRAVGRFGNPFGKETRKSYPVLGSGTGNCGQQIFGIM